MNYLLLYFIITSPYILYVYTSIVINFYERRFKLVGEFVIFDSKGNENHITVKDCRDPVTLYSDDVPTTFHSFNDLISLSRILHITIFKKEDNKICMI